MCELEQLIQQLLELSKNNPESLFKIVPNEDKTGWSVEFTKGHIWWGVYADKPDEELKDILEEALSYFERVTDEMIAAYNLELNAGLEEG